MDRPANETPDTPMLSGYAGRLLLSTSLIWLTVVTGRLLLPPLLPSIIDDFAISLAAAGLVLTILQAATGIVLFPAGRLSDQLSRATVILPALGILVVGVLLIGSAPVYPVLVVGALVYGLGNGLFNITARTLIGDHFVARRGRALGVFTAAFSIGAVLASGLAVLTFEDWRRAFFLLAGLFAVGTAVYLRWNEEPFVRKPVSLELVGTFRRLAGVTELRNPILGFACFGVASQSILAFFPAYLQAEKGFSPFWASAGFALIFTLGIVAKVGAGSFSDRYPRRSVAAAGLLLAGGGLIGILLVDSRLLLFAAIVAFAVGHQAQFPLIDAILLDATPADTAGGDLGAARTIYLLVGATGPLLTGAVADRTSFTVAFAGLVALLLVAAVVLRVGKGETGA